MSLHHASKYLASKGRGEDTMLVHMTPREVKGLQELALAHGGSLTINPETGLPEAGILKTLLPMVGGAALMMIPGMQGFGGALAASAIMGGGMYAATGSIKEGLLAGLGAFGGANLAGGLAAAGAEAGAAGVADASAGALEATAAPGSQAATLTAQNTAMGLTPAEQAAQAIGATQTGAGSQAAMLAEQNAAMGLTPTQSYANLMTSSGAPVSATGSAVATPVAGNVVPGAANPTGLGGTFTENAQNVYKGLPQIGKVVMANPMSTVGAAAAPLLMNASSSAGPSQSSTGEENPMGFMTLSPDFKGYQPPQPNPYYTAQYPDYKKKPYGMAEGGIAELAQGGDPMAPMQNTVYPQSQQDHTQFATPTQYPNSMKMAMASDYDTRTNPQTGAESPIGLAAGGVARYADGGMSLSDLGQLLSGQNNPNILAQYAGAKLTGQLGNNAAGTATAPTGPVSPGYVGFEGDTIGDGITPSNPFMRSATTTTAISAPASQTGWGQNAQGYNSFSSGSSSSGNTGTGLATSGNNGVFPLEGQYGIVKMASGGVPAYASGHLASSASMPAGGIYRDTDANTASKGAYEAALYRLQKANKLAGIKTAMPKAAMTSLGSVDADVAEAASGGIAHYSLGGYSDGGRMLKGPGDGMSDSIPASIGAKQPARLADGEFVVPADVVSHLGNGSTDAGAKKLYSMMDKVRKARTGTKKQGKQINADKFTPK